MSRLQRVRRRYTSAAAAAFLLTAPAPTAGQQGGVDPRALAAQVALDRAGFSPGEIDGRFGPRTRLALDAYAAAFETPLDVSANPLVAYVITQEDASGPFVGALPGDLMEQSKLPALGYTSIVEMLGERFHCSPKLLRTLNPAAQWSAGESIQVPGVEPFEVPAPPIEGEGSGQIAKGRSGAAPAPAAPPVEIVLTGSTRTLVVRDRGGRTLLFAPVTTGSEHDPLPIGSWKVRGISWEPVFNYNPALFWDADASQGKTRIAPGPNNPVGVVWIDIDKEHYGLHGTPEPAAIGRTESHGCIRLTNWDATRLARLVAPGTPVIFTE